MSLFGHLRCSPGVTPSKNVVLVDDVVTRGGHLQACELVLNAYHGQSHVTLAVCAGFTNLTAISNPFERKVVEYERIRIPPG